MAEPGTSIEDLPPEMIERVASWCDEPRDLLNLRLVNKYIGASSHRPMLKANFATLNIMLALPSSLERAVRVARAKHLNSYIRRVRIFIDQFQRTILNFPSPLRPEAEENTADDTKLGRQLPSKQFRVYLRWVTDQFDLEVTKSDEARIQEIFNMLSSLPNIGMSVLDLNCVREGEYALPMPKDFDGLKEEYGEEPPMGPHWRNHRPLYIILKAIQMSGLKLVDFNCLCYNYGVPLTMFIPGTGFWQIAENLRGTQGLGLRLQAGPEGTDSRSDPLLISHFLGFLNTYSSTLECLDLDTDSEEDAYYEYWDLDAIFNAMRASVFFPRLKSLWIRRLSAKYQDFISYLGAHKATLQSYGTEGCAFTDTDTELTNEAFEKKLVEDLKAAGLPAPESCWSAVNDDVEEA